MCWVFVDIENANILGSDTQTAPPLLHTVSSGKQDDLYYKTTSNIRQEIRKNKPENPFQTMISQINPDSSKNYQNWQIDGNC